jgi:hypothetical protein
MATTKSTSYEMVNSQEWSRNDHNTVPQVVTRDEKTERTMERRKQYELSSLDNVWNPILANKLTKVFIFTSKCRSLDQPDVGQTGAGYHSQSRITIEDEIDGRGTFAAKDLEKELRSMHRSELEDQLGITWTKVREIIRRGDYDNDSIVEYKDFLETVKQYRLNTEQESVLQSLVKAFAYAKEFTCFPPRLFMVVITLIETAFFLPFGPFVNSTLH